MRIVKKTKEGVLLSYRKGDQPQFITWKDFEEKYTIVDGFYVDYKKPTLGDHPVLQALAKAQKKHRK